MQAYQNRHIDKAHAADGYVSSRSILEDGVPQSGNAQQGWVLWHDPEARIASVRVRGPSASSWPQKLTVDRADKEDKEVIDLVFFGSTGPICGEIWRGRFSKTDMKLEGSRVRQSQCSQFLISSLHPSL